MARELESVAAAVEYPEGTVPLTQNEVGEPIEAAQLMLFLASDAAKHITGTEVSPWDGLPGRPENSAVRTA